MAKSRAKKSGARNGANEDDNARIEGRTLRVGRERMPLLSGAMHYFRLDPDAWRPALRELRAMGLPIVETYTPWGVHEVSPGEFDFGAKNPRHDLGRFIDLAAEEGLWVFIRPGPHINAEMTHFGLPERVVYDKACQARSPRQNPVILPFPPQMFPVPSYASERFHEEAGLWYDAVGEIVAPRIYPNGPVVLLQVDNEASYYFRNGAFDQDYHPDAIAMYQRFVIDRYSALPAAAKAHGQRYETESDINPPTRFEGQGAKDLPRYLDWAEFQEQLITNALSRLRKRMAQAGLTGVPVTHNVALGEAGLPISLPAIDSVVDLMGLDYYHPAREHRTIKRRTLLLAGTVELPYSPEMGVGAPPWFTPLTHGDSMYCTLTALAFGLRGLNLYMAVDRDRWYGSPIDARGRSRAEASTWRNLFTRLTEVRFEELTRKAKVGLVIPPEYRRLSRVTHLFGGLVSPAALEALGGTPVDGCREDRLGFEGPIQVLWWQMLAKLADALTEAQVPYVWLDGDAPDARFEELSVVFCPTYEFSSASRWERLMALTEDGATVIYGPCLPEFDVDMAEHDFQAPAGSRHVRIDEPHDAQLLVDELIRDLDLSRPFRVSPAPLETAVHEDTVGPRVLFVMNPTRNLVMSTITLHAPSELVDLATGERITGREEAEVPVPGLTCRVFVIERSNSDPPPKRRPSARRKAQ